MLATGRAEPSHGVGDGLVAEVRYLERTPTGLRRPASAERNVDEVAPAAAKPVDV